MKQGVVLIVEDEQRLAEVLKKQFETEELKKPEIPKELEQLVEEFAEKKLNVAPTKPNIS